MSAVKVTYRLHPDRVEEHLELVRAVFAELDERRPPGLRYRALQLDDGVTFVHIGEDAAELRELPAFQAFLRGLDERCEDPPVVTQIRIVGRHPA